MELKEEEKMLQVEKTSETEGLGAVSKPVTGTDQIITLDRLAASVRTGKWSKIIPCVTLGGIIIIQMFFM